jgi:hypothetical protein
MPEWTEAAWGIIEHEYGLQIVFRGCFGVFGRENKLSAGLVSKLASPSLASLSPCKHVCP